MSSLSTPLETSKEQILEHENKIVLLWSVVLWLVVMNTTMFNVALPTVKDELALTSDTASWIVSGYSIAFAISAVTYGRLSDFVPIKRLLLIGLSIVGLSSLIGFFSTTFVWLLIARVLQAIGAGAVPGLAMVLAGKYIPVSRRGRAMSMIASAASLGFGLGPVLGGVITQYIGWHFMFLVTGFVLCVAPFLLKLLPSEEKQNGNFDFIGAILTGGSVTGLLIYFTTFTYYYLIGSVIMFLLLWKRIHTIALPFIQPRLLRNLAYMQLVFIVFSGFLVHFSALFLMPIMLTSAFEFDAASVGLMIFPGAMLSAAAAQLIGRLIDRYGNTSIILTGHLLLVIATVLFAFVSTVSPYFIMATYMFMSVGFSSLTSSTTNEVTRRLPKAEVGAAMGLVQLMQFFGGAFGAALSGLLLVWQVNLDFVVSYRNIWLLFTGLLLLSATFAFFYQRAKKYSSNE
ncbi:MFS transporter [Alkalihalobacillus sp. MEB130]|uniref:MFS transporter n=1 Tax=Alkalihalobacillus sp. MEB130 TaxID=2976704 RepID=UPI0028DE6333|nr:MFS transporter [Alkalihalobacillus sp. MEB130]MDT8860666.1 MFS transporter [Alkalihalobacillus sp. MEB130]